MPPREPYPFVWPQLSPQIQTKLLNQLPKLIYSEEHRQTGLELAKLQGKLAAIVLKVGEKGSNTQSEFTEWPEFNEILLNFLLNKETSWVEYGFCIVLGLL